MNTTLSSFLKNYSQLHAFNSTFGKKVIDAFPNEHHFAKEAVVIGGVHQNTQKCFEQ